MKFERAVCPVCSRTVAINVPHGGDGSASVFRWHRQTPGGVLCPMSRGFVEPSQIVVEP